MGDEEGHEDIESMSNRRYQTIGEIIAELKHLFSDRVWGWKDV